ncbi:YheU family protein [Bdellovibrio sp. SKB1291214]|uniref:YheU family protein n=1 Tax=Bdellovibrio sp. SKB1291214 TaxID=1732569 RepID=UPI000B5195E5|nr:YheU family protein [Bdellovibrio sp. SKB1291214]UYL07759.1 YheU family protein [Bdellovibrio sp. SKB1291214]
MDFIDDNNSPENDVKPPIAIELDRLSADVIDAVIEAFILREGTDYGVVEISLDKKKEQVLKQLNKKELHIVYDFNTDSVTVMTDRDWKKLPRSE